MAAVAEIRSKSSGTVSGEMWLKECSDQCSPSNTLTTKPLAEKRPPMLTLVSRRDTAQDF